MNSMHLLLPALPSPILGAFFADISNIPWVAIIAVGGSLLLTIILGACAIVFGLKHSQRQQELWHETARIALEKGQPLPPMPAGMKSETRPETRSNDFRSGLILIGVGGGLYLFFRAMNLDFLRYVGAIPGLIGVALLLFAVAGSVFGPKDDSAPRS